MSRRILVIDDDRRVLNLFESMLSQEEFQVIPSNNAAEAKAKIEKELFDLIICDQSLGDTDGMQMLAHTQQHAPTTPFVIITGYGSIPKAVESVKKGAFEYIIKPVQKEMILKVIERAIQEAALRIPHKSMPTLYTEIAKTMVGQSGKMQKLFDLVQQIAKTSATVLIQGESGTGKELIARAIHQLSLRASAPIVAINCGALSENLLENELFGHVQGAFTGATRHKKGLLEIANKGTVFFDEIGDMPLSVQIKVLRVLQEREFKPLGSNETIHVDVRMIAATNVDLQAAVASKQFREDLYYRLAVIPLRVPPLRERSEDIPLLAMHFVQKYCTENNKKIELIAPEAMARLMAYHWPGNVRELENTIARSVALAPATTITLDLLDQRFLEPVKPQLLMAEATGQEETADRASGKNSPITEDSPTPVPFVPNHTPASASNHSATIAPTPPAGVLLKEILQRDTQTAILGAIAKAHGNYSEAARILGISRASLYNKLKQYQMQFARKKEL